MKHHAYQRPPATRALTLAELTLAIGLVAILMAFLLPSLNKARDVARKHADRSNLKQLVTSVGFYAMSNMNEAPQGWGSAGCGYYATTIENRVGQFMKYGSGGTGKGFTGLGLLYTSGLVTDASLFYSPTSPDRLNYTSDAWGARGWNKNGGQNPVGTYIQSNYFYAYASRTNIGHAKGTLSACQDSDGNVTGTVEAVEADINHLIETNNAFLWTSICYTNEGTPFDDGHNIGFYDGAVIFHNGWKRYPGQAKSWAEELAEKDQPMARNVFGGDRTDCWGYGVARFDFNVADKVRP